MNQRDDLGSNTPGDWLGLVRERQDWGFPACYGQGGSACKDVPKPVGVLDPHAAAGGVAFLGGAALVAEWQLGVVERVALGTGSVSTFVTGLKNPLPLIVARDGSLLVGDWSTGTIYRVTGA
jgi:glucose/arabinose dehydrogenase